MPTRTRVGMFGSNFNCLPRCFNSLHLWRYLFSTMSLASDHPFVGPAVPDNLRPAQPDLRDEASQTQSPSRRRIPWHLLTLFALTIFAGFIRLAWIERP